MRLGFGWPVGSALTSILFATSACGTLAATGSQEPTYFGFNWVACEQRQVDDDPRGACQIDRSEQAAPGFVLFVSSVRRVEDEPDDGAFLDAASKSAGVAFRTAGWGKIELSRPAADQTREMFLQRLADLYGSRLRVVTVDPAGPPSENFRTEDPDRVAWTGYGLKQDANSLAPGVRFLASAFDDLDVSTEMLVSYLRATDEISRTRSLNEQHELLSDAHLLVGNYLYRVGRLFPRFNRPVDFAVLGHDLDELGVRPPRGAERGDAQFVQVAFLRYLLNSAPGAGDTMGIYLVALEDLEASLLDLTSEETPADARRAGLAMLRKRIDDLEASYASFRPILARPFEPERLGALAPALNEEIVIIEQQLAQEGEQ